VATLNFLGKSQGYFEGFFKFFAVLEELVGQGKLGTIIQLGMDETKLSAV
jgi:hypothetical protein